MNILNTPNSNIKGKGNAGTNVLDLLGNQKNLTPAQIKLLQSQGKLQADQGEFQTLFGNTKKKNTDGKQQALHQKLMANNPKAHNKDILGQEVQLNNIVKKPMDGALALQNTKNGNHQKMPQGETPVARVLKLGQSENVKATVNNPNAGVDLLGNNKQSAEQQLKTHQSLMGIAQKNKVNNKNVKNLDSKLVDFNTFMQKQTPQVRGRIAAKSEMYQSAAQKSKSLFANKVKGETQANQEASRTKMTNLQDIMLKSENSDSTNNQSSNNQSSLDQNLMNSKVMMKDSMGMNTAKVFDMSQLNSNMGQNEIISKIQDYAIQTRAGNEPQLEVSFKHRDLGQIDLMIQKLHNNQLQISIGTNSVEAGQFFTQNQGELLQSLTQAGLSIGDLKLESGKLQNQNLAGDFDRDGEPGQNQKQKQPGSESGERQEEQQRRQELWNQFKDKEAA